MIKKYITMPMLVPKLEAELDLSEIGLLATMVNEVDADYKSVKHLRQDTQHTLLLDNGCLQCSKHYKQLLSGRSTSRLVLMR